MNVASIDLCKELYELSGWNSQHWMHAYCTGKGFDPKYFNSETADRCKGWQITDRYDAYREKERFTQVGRNRLVPAYDLGYLLRKVPARFEHGEIWYGLTGFPNGLMPWFAYESTASGDNHRWGKHLGSYPNRAFTADSPENALCKLAIELFKQGILTKEPPHA